jgi:hypothetical protein
MFIFVKGEAYGLLKQVLLNELAIGASSVGSKGLLRKPERLVSCFAGYCCANAHLSAAPYRSRLRSILMFLYTSELIPYQYTSNYYVYLY